MNRHHQTQRPRDFGMDIRNTSTRWSDIAKGPTLKQFATHVAKLASFVAPWR